MNSIKLFSWSCGSRDVVWDREMIEMWERSLPDSEGIIQEFIIPDWGNKTWRKPKQRWSASEFELGISTNWTTAPQCIIIAKTFPHNKDVSSSTMKCVPVLLATVLAYNQISLISFRGCFWSWSCKDVLFKHHVVLGLQGTWTRHFLTLNLNLSSVHMTNVSIRSGNAANSCGFRI